MAELEFHFGLMNSGKTTALLQEAHTIERARQNNGHKRLVIAKPATDTKAGSSLEARVGLSRPVDLLITPEMDVRKALNERWLGSTAIKRVLIDEAQFLSVEQADQLHDVAVFDDTRVGAYGLRTDFIGQGFPGSLRLFEIAHSRIEHVTECLECGEKANFNARRVNGLYVSHGDQIAIDGKEEVTYDPLCSGCFYRHVGRPIDLIRSKNS